MSSYGLYENITYVDIIIFNQYPEKNMFLSKHNNWSGYENANYIS